MRMEYLHTLFAVLQHGSLFILPQIFIHLFIPLQIHRYLFHTLDYNPKQFYFIVQIVQRWPLEALSFDSCVPLIYTHHYVFVLAFFFFLSTSLLPGTIRCSSFILYISCRSPRIRPFSNEPWLLSMKNGIESKIWVLYMLAISSPSQLT